MVTCKRTESHIKAQEESLNICRRDAEKKSHQSMYSSSVGDKIYTKANRWTRGQYRR